MPIHRKQNQYRGVNAHLHSYFQQRGGWADFHNAHIADLAGALARALAAYPDYTVRLEPSLQTAYYDVFTNASTTSTPRPDANMHEFVWRRELSDLPSSATRPTHVLSASNLFIEEEAVGGVVIYKAGQAVTRVELLNPASKPPGSHHFQYNFRRSQCLCSLVKLVELDYLHERRSPISDMPDYTRYEPDSYPYMIAVGEMRSSIGPGQFEIHAFRVEDPIPIIALPLDDEDMLTFDFGMVYHQTFYEQTLFGLRHVDYQKLPDAFGVYDEEDKKRIKARMAMVAAQQRGDDAD